MRETELELERDGVPTGRNEKPVEIESYGLGEANRKMSSGSVMSSAGFQTLTQQTASF